MRGIVFLSPGEHSSACCPNLCSHDLGSARKRTGAPTREVEGRRTGGDEGAGVGGRRVHCLFTFTQITLVACRSKFRNLNKKTLILLCHGGCDLWRVCSLTYYSAVNFTDNPCDVVFSFIIAICQILIMWPQKNPPTIQLINYTVFSSLFERATEAPGWRFTKFKFKRTLFNPLRAILKEHRVVTNTHTPADTHTHKHKKSCGYVLSVGIETSVISLVGVIYYYFLRGNKNNTVITSCLKSFLFIQILLSQSKLS